MFEIRAGATYRGGLLATTSVSPMMPTRRLAGRLVARRDTGSERADIDRLDVG